MKPVLRTLRLAVAAAVLCLPALAGAEPLAVSPDRDIADAYTLGAGDRVKVTVFGESDLSGTFEVSSTAIISMPLIGEVEAGGRTVRELESQITQKLLDGYLKDPQVGAEVVNYRPFYIIGEVRQPGSYAYVNGMTVLNAVALGGGFTHRARESKVWLTRGGDQVKKEVMVEATTPIMPGDVIRVAERFF